MMYITPAAMPAPPALNVATHRIIKKIKAKTPKQQLHP
jgi:hypothetical protein